MQRWAVACLLATVACMGATVPAEAAHPVPSLTPAKTRALWTRLVHARSTPPRTLARAADCRPARIVVYAQTDWLRVATKLAQNASPCAQYYISVPPLASDKTQLRRGQAAKIRALGSSFHALAEINWNGWNRWVAANQSNWSQAGIVARQHMAAAGFDVNRGDTWALNELTSAVRKNTGAARQNVRDFIRGLYIGDGSQPATKGVVFVIGAGQSTPDVASYKTSLQSWFQDAAFWGDMAAYVSDWGQETYGDARDYAVAGAPAQERRDVLERYLGHPIALARVAPPEAAAAAGFLSAAYLPVANAAWAWASSYGWTQMPFEQMEDYVSAQVYAARALEVADGTSVDRFGFAWAPYNSLQLAPHDFTTQSAAILDRLGAAIRDSAETVDPADPGVGACGPLGQPSWCTTVLDGAVFPTAWLDFSTWTQSAVGYASAPVTVAAGAVSGPITLQLQTGTVPTPALAPTTITLTSSSPHGQFSASPVGPWAPVLAVTVPVGSSNAIVYYQDTIAGTPTVSAAVTGQPAATQTETVLAGPAASLSVSASVPSVLEGGSVLLTFTAADALGNAIATTPTWTVQPAALGRITAVDGTATFVAGATPGAATITAKVGSVVASALITVNAPPPRVKFVHRRYVRGHLVVTVRIVAGGKPAKGVRVGLLVRRGSSRVGKASGRTSYRGQIVWRSHGKLPHARYVVKVTLPRRR